MRSIKRLPKSVHSAVRSSIVLFDFPRVVEELVYNSIDAGSTKVDISINVRACYVKVADDGCGITRDGLVILGEKYATSKLKSTAEIESSNSNMGFKGETIGSLSDISLVEIRTKARGWPNAYCKIIKGSKCIFLGIDEQREAVGTTVMVRELFYNQPVRRKCMQSSPKKVLHSVKKCVLQIALVHPQISFRVTDTESEEELLCTVASSSSPLSLISSGFGISSSLHEIVYSDELYTLSGFISGPSDTSTKVLQYLYINSRFVSKGAIHNSINNLANRFHIQTDQIIRDEFSKSQSRKRTKYDRCPSFLLNLSCPLSSYDLSFEPSKTTVEFKDLNIVLSFFERAVMKFWKGLPRDPLEETCCVEDSASLSLERESLKQEGDKSLASRRKRKSQSQSQTTHYPSSTLKNIAQEINDDILYETPPRNSHANNSFSLNRCKNEASSSFTSNTNNHDWLDNEYISPNIMPKNSRNYEKTSLTFEDNKPFMKSCSRERNCFLEDEYPKREHFSDFEKIGGDFCNFQNSFYADNNMYLHEKSTEWNFPETSRNNFGSTEKDWVFNSPRKKSRDMKKIESFGFGYSKLMENEDEILESNEDLNIFSEIPTVNHRKSKAFEFSNSECNTGFHFLDSPITKKNSEFQFLDSPITKTNSDFQFPDSPITKKNSEFQFPDSPIAKKNSNFQFPDSPIAKKNSEFQFLDSSIPKEKSEFQFPDSPIIKKNSEFHFPDSPITKKNPEFQFPDSPITKNSSEFQFLDSPITKNSSEFQLQDSPVIKRSDGLSLKSPFDESKLRKYPLDKVRARRSRSAPPFHKGKSKFSALNECLTALTGQNPSFHVSKTSPVEMHLSQLCCKKPPSLETPELNFREKSKEETKRQDEFERTEEELTKWRADPIQPSTVFSLNNNNSAEDILSISCGLLSLSSDSNSLIPQSIEREILEDARVLLQIDKKFIPVIAKDTLIILDQHAADERIRLEDLRRKVLSGEGCGVTNLASEEELVLPEMGFQLLEKYNEHIKKWGWITSNDIKSSDPFTKNMSVLKKHVSAITLVAVPCILGTNLTSKDLVEFLEQLVETDGSANIPPSVIRILNSKACRGAIMFGDPLLPSECSLILEELKATSLCFQCAHGRPTTVPILNIKRLHDELAKIEMQNDTWHGLRHNKLTLERAKTRLSQAKM